MRSAVLRRFYLMLALAPAASGCMTSPAQRFVGVSPVLDPVSVERSSGNISRVMAALSRDAGGGSMYEVTEAGFNYVDDRCMEYFSELFYLNRRKDAAKAGLGAFDKTTNAILAATGASTLTMGVLAQVFGLAANLTDIAAGTYLYQLPPATTLSFVKTLQGAYREAASAKRSQITTQATAYHIIQDYLSLCLPPVIEAELVKHIADAAASPVRGGSVSNIEISVASEAPAPVRREVVTIIQKPSAALPKPTGPRPAEESEQPNAVGAWEMQLKRSFVSKLQKSLCVPTANGIIDKQTRIAVDDFFGGVEEAGIGRDYPNALENGIQSEHDSKLRAGIKAVPDCSARPGTNAFIVGQIVS
jgi:hypothetical protein